MIFLVIVRPIIVNSQQEPEYIKLTYDDEEEQLLQSDPRVVEELYANWNAEKLRLAQNQRRERRQFVPSTVTKVAYSYPGYTAGQLKNCYNFVKEDILVGYGAAKNHPAPLKEPKTGLVMVSYESNLGHYSRVIAVFENEFVVAEFNYIHGAYTERIIKKGSPFIKGFYQKT